MKIKDIHRGTLSLASFTCLAAALLLLVTACDNKDYSKDSPFDNTVYIDAAIVKDIANFTFNNLRQTGPADNLCGIGIPCRTRHQCQFSGRSFTGKPLQCTPRNQPYHVGCQVLQVLIAAGRYPQRRCNFQKCNH